MAVPLEYAAPARARDPVPSVQHPTKLYGLTVGRWASVAMVLDDEDVFVELTGTELEVVVAGRVLEVNETTEDVVELGLLDKGVTLLLLLLLLDTGAELDIDELIARELRPPVLDDETAATEYSSRRFPLPQNWKGLPAQTMLQSATGAEALVEARVSPQ